MGKKAINVKYQFQSLCKKMNSLFNKMFKIRDANPGVLDDISPKQFNYLENQTDMWLELCKSYYDTHPEEWNKRHAHAGYLYLIYKGEGPVKKDQVDPKEPAALGEKARNCSIETSARRDQGKIAAEIKMEFTPLDHDGKSMCLVNLNELMTKLGKSIEKEGLAFDTEEGIAADAFDAEYKVPQDQSVIQAIMTRSKE